MSKFKIVEVNENFEKYYIIKKKPHFWSRWTPVCGNRWFTRNGGYPYGFGVLKFRTYEKCERYLRERLMKHEVSESVVGEFDESPSKFKINFIKRDRENDEYIRNLNSYEVRR